MGCSKCDHNVVCKYYLENKQNLYMEIEIKKCIFFKESNNLTFKEENNIKQNTPTTQQNYKQSGLYKDFNLKNKSKPKINTCVSINKVECDLCHNQVDAMEIDNCIECGNKVCMDCRVSVFDATKGNVVSTCEKCWSGSYDDKKTTSPIKKDDKWDLNDFIEEVTKEEENVTRKKVNSKRSNK